MVLDSSLSPWPWGWEWSRSPTLAYWPPSFLLFCLFLQHVNPSAPLSLSHFSITYSLIIMGPTCLVLQGTRQTWGFLPATWASRVQDGHEGQVTAWAELHEEGWMSSCLPGLSFKMDYWYFFSPYCLHYDSKVASQCCLRCLLHDLVPIVSTFLQRFVLVLVLLTDPLSHAKSLGRTADSCILSYAHTLRLGTYIFRTIMVFTLIFLCSELYLFRYWCSYSYSFWWHFMKLKWYAT